MFTVLESKLKNFLKCEISQSPSAPTVRTQHVSSSLRTIHVRPGGDGCGHSRSCDSVTLATVWPHRCPWRVGVPLGPWTCLGLLRRRETGLCGVPPGVSVGPLEGNLSGPCTHVNWDVLFKAVCQLTKRQNRHFKHTIVGNCMLHVYFNVS